MVALTSLCWSYPTGHLIVGPLYRDANFSAALQRGFENPSAMLDGYKPNVSSSGRAEAPASPPVLLMVAKDSGQAAKGIGLSNSRFMESSQKLKGMASLAKATKAIKRQQMLTSKLSRALQGKALFVFEVILGGGEMENELCSTKIKAVEGFLRNIQLEGLLWGPPRQVQQANKRESRKIHVPCTMEGKLFASIDLSGDGTMDREEFAAACREGGVVMEVKKQMEGCNEIEAVEVIVQQL